LLVVTGARCLLTKPVVTAVELQATTEPRCSRGAQPGGIYVYVVQREPTPGGPGCSGVGIVPRPQALPLPATALILYVLPSSSKTGGENFFLPRATDISERLLPIVIARD
jgi:hypothetical protein